MIEEMLFDKKKECPLCGAFPLYVQRTLSSHCQTLTDVDLVLYPLQSDFTVLVLLPRVLLFTLSISLNKFLLLQIPGTKHLTYLVIVDFTFKTCINVPVLHVYIKNSL